MGRHLCDGAGCCDRLPGLCVPGIAFQPGSSAVAALVAAFLTASPQPRSRLSLWPVFACTLARGLKKRSDWRGPTKQAEPTRARRDRWIALWPGIAIGLALAAGYAFQTFGLRFTTPAKAGFITGLSVALVPIGQAIFLRRPPSLNAVVGVALATVGLGLLSLNAALGVNLGDLLVLCCAVAFAVHILLVGRYAPHWQPLRLAFVQIATVAVVTAALALLLERPIGWPAGNVWFAAAFTGLFATALAFFVQSRAQQATTPTHTALIFAAEPVFAGLFSFLLIGEVFLPRQFIGAALIVAGMLVAELWRRGGR